MLVAPKALRSTSRRSAFTLVEVLVVVAIVVILASVGTIATLKFLEDAKVDNARMSAMALVEAAKTAETKNLDGIDFEQTGVQVLAQYLDKGEAGLYDPWGQPYQITYVEVPVSGSDMPSRRVFIYCQHPQTGKIYGWPKEFEPQGQ